MSGIAIKFHQGPVTFAAEKPVVGGQLVQAGSKPRTIVPAEANSTTILGVAVTDAAPAGDTFSGVPEHVAVAYGPAQVPIKGKGLAVGDLAVAATGGTVAKAGEAATTAQLVGRVIEVLDEETVSVRLYV